MLWKQIFTVKSKSYTKKFEMFIKIKE
jgi:hypothetical protein